MNTEYHGDCRNLKDVVRGTMKIICKQYDSRLESNRCFRERPAEQKHGVRPHKMPMDCQSQTTMRVQGPKSSPGKHQVVVKQ